MRRHVAFVLASSQLYIVNLGIVWHSVALGLFESRFAAMLTWASLLTYLSAFALVRSGWTQRLPDPVLTLPHALVSIGLCILAYTQLDEHRASVLILVAEALVMCMFRLRPTQMLGLGLASVGMLLGAVVWLTWHDPVRYPASTGLMHFVIGGSTLLILSLVAKWVTDIRVRIGSQARELSRALDTLQHMATQDTLTGLLNRRTMTDLAEAERVNHNVVARALAMGASLAPAPDRSAQCSATPPSAWRTYRPPAPSPRPQSAAWR